MSFVKGPVADLPGRTSRDRQGMTPRRWPARGAGQWMSASGLMAGGQFELLQHRWWLAGEALQLQGVPAGGRAA